MRELLFLASGFSAAAYLDYNNTTALILSVACFILCIWNPQSEGIEDEVSMQDDFDWQESTEQEISMGNH